MDDYAKGQALYFELKEALTKKLTALGFTVKSESTTGLAPGIDFEKGGFLVKLGLDYREKTLTLNTSKDGKSTGSAYISTGKGAETTVFTKLNELLAAEGLKVEIPAAGGFLSKLFGKK